ncbi:MAG TPA: DUF1800 domain-containing protein [Pirellulaceae bacterium]|nr:DUF1800 domain-containing protein [Pirellulaceae bacterium]
MQDDWNRIEPAWAWTPFQATGAAWDHRRAAHLMRRAGFCATPREIHQAVERGFDATLDLVFTPPESDSFDAEMDALGASIAAAQPAQRLAAWWMLRMVQTPWPLAEKMTLFWHGHFATSAAKVRDGRAMFAQNQTLRQMALGPFGDLVQAISRDVAMLIYLDSTDNRKTRPNENYARELLELFCLGLDQYSEQDIKQLARCFTGWEVRQGHFNFNPAQHDRGSKTLFGETGAFDGEEAVQIVLSQPAAPRFIVRKLIRFFVADEVEIPDALVEPLAAKLRADDFRIEPLVRAILGSQLFFSEFAVGRKVRSPVELAVGLLRSLGTSANMDQLVETLETLGQLPLFPPNVKGWDGGRNWINAATLLARQRLSRQLIEPVIGQSVTAMSRRGWSEIVRGDAAALAERLCQLWLAADPPESVMNILRDAAAEPGELGRRLRNVALTICVLPEFQLC